MLYVFDTSSLRAMGHFFPEQFPSLWIKFDAMVESGDVVSVREVRKELELQSVHQHLLDWAKGHGSFFRIPSTDETEFVSQIFAVPKFLEMVRRKNILEGRSVPRGRGAGARGLRGHRGE